MPTQATRIFYMSDSYEFSLAKSVFEGTLDLLCPKMELISCKDNSEIVLKGIGVIRSDTRGRLYFRMVAPRSLPLHPVLNHKKNPGEVYTDDDAVFLLATDDAGNKWQSNPIIIDAENDLPTLDRNIRHGLDSIELSDRSIRKDNVIRMYIPQFDRLPFDSTSKTITNEGETWISTSRSLDHHKLKLCNALITFRGRQNWLHIEGTGDNAFARYLPELLCHSLEFTTNKSARPTLILREFDSRVDLGLYSGPFNQPGSRLPPPTLCESPDQIQSYWNLFENYFGYIANDTEHVNSQLLMDDLEGIRDGSRGSLRTACLTLAIGIESLAKRLLPESIDKIQNVQIDELLKYIYNWGGDFNIKNRAANIVGNIKGCRAVDKLYKWARANAVSDSLVDAWKDVRNPVAHGSSVIEDQQNSDNYYRAAELLNRLVASIIGFKGEITPSSQRSWQVQNDTPK